MDRFWETLWFLFMLWTAIFAVIVGLLVRGVIFMLKRYWYVWLGVVVFACAFYYFNPNLGEKEEAVAIEMDCKSRSFVENGFRFLEVICVGGGVTTNTMSVGGEPVRIVVIDNEFVQKYQERLKKKKVYRTDI